MGQFSMEIYALTGSLLSGNLHIGTILRHSSPETTAIYAKVDLPMLMKIAQPWPGDLPC